MSTSQNEITKTIKSRIYLKHDISSNWDKANNFRPKKGEIIIYDPEGAQLRPRIKIGDDATLVKDLKFIDEKLESDINILLENIEDINKDIDSWKESLQNTENSIDGKITTAIANLLADTGEEGKIDTIKEILDWISGIDPDSSAVEILKQVETNKNNIQTLSNQHSNFQTRIEEAENKIELNTETNQSQAETLLTQASLINELENQHTEINERILGLQAEDDKINQHLENVDGSIETIDTDIKDIKQNITNLENSLTEKINTDIQTTKNGINEDLVDLENRLNTNLETEVQTINGAITNIEKDITNMKQKDDNFSSTIGELNLAVQTINQNITTLTNEDTNINQKINNLENKDKTLEENINDIYNVKIPDLIDTIDELNENLVVATFDDTKNTLKLIPEITQTKGKLQKVGLEDYIEISLEDKDTTYTAGTGLELTEENVFNHTNSITARNNFNNLFLPSENGKVDFLINDFLYNNTGHITDYKETEITIPGAGEGLAYNKDNKTYDHINKITKKTTYNQSSASPGYGGTFKITEPCFDEHGHITELRVATITMPSTQEIPTSFNIEANGEGDGIVNLSLTGGANSVSGQVSHKQYLNNSNSSNTNSDIGSNGGTLYIPNLSVDKYGHISSFEEQEIQITMPTYPNLDQDETPKTVNIEPNSSKQVNFTAISSLSVNNHQIIDDKTTYTLDLSDFALSDEVASAISSAMVFKGTLGTNGTITSLPIASINTEGDSYKVITAGTYNNEEASVGDMFVCCKPVGSNNYDWVLIPSGDDEYKGTITSITAGTGLTGNTITTSGTISHASPGEAAITKGPTANVSGTNAIKIPYIQIDALGHVKTLSEYTYTGVDTKVTAVGNHYTPAKSKTISASSTTSATFGSTDFVTGIEMDAAGHVTGVTSAQMPSDRLFTTLVPKGTQISTTGTDLNTITYLSVGKYFCSQITTAKTLLNCPTNAAFMMEVYSPLATTIDNETTGIWTYRLRKVIEYNTGITYYQMCNTGKTANVWTYGAWYQVPENLISIDDTTSPPTRTYQKGNSNTPIYLDNNGRFQACSRSFTELNNYLPLAGGTITGNVTFNANNSSQKNEPKLIWKTIGQNTPYIGFAEDQTDGTFVICSMEQSAEVGTNGSRNYKNGLAIDGGSGNLFWKGNKIAVTSDIPTSLKNPNSLTIQSNGTTIGSYDGSSAKTINIPASTVTLNGTSTTSASFYAPTTAGTSGYVLKSNGSGAPTWTSATLTDTKVTTAANTSSTKSYVTTCTGATTGTLTYHTNVYINHSTGVLMGAAWNDYAEYREQVEEIKPGYCVVSNDNGKVSLTTEKFQACDGIVSDTFGFAIGETDKCKTPLAVAGRVLAYAENPEELHSGDTVCAGPNGKVIKMTREEIREWPDRIVGIVSEIPTYETWGTGNVKVNGRIWIKIK